MKLLSCCCCCCCCCCAGRGKASSPHEGTGLLSGFRHHLPIIPPWEREGMAVSRDGCRRKSLAETPQQESTGPGQDAKARKRKIRAQNHERTYVFAYAQKHRHSFYSSILLSNFNNFTHRSRGWRHQRRVHSAVFFLLVHGRGEHKPTPLDLPWYAARVSDPSSLEQNLRGPIWHALITSSCTHRTAEV